MSNKALYKIGYGMYVISSKNNGKFNGQIANTVFQITSDPPTIAVSIHKNNLTHEYINTSKAFAVSILNKNTPMQFIGIFGFKSGRDSDKFKDVEYKIGMTGAPVVLDNALAYLDAEVINSLDVGTHTVFIGKIVDSAVINETEPMTYDYYHEVKKGKAPTTAPTYMKETETKDTKNMSTSEKYRCTVCDYIYDPEKGDSDAGIKPGTPFSELPEDWVCPICGQGKSVFEKIE
jgi:flavin reductase (DIM6/NTAB) family NADH-FMN oxidoreductase RutF/rubredoxin